MSTQTEPESTETHANVANTTESDQILGFLEGEESSNVPVQLVQSDSDTIYSQAIELNGQRHVIVSQAQDPETGELLLVLQGENGDHIAISSEAFAGLVQVSADDATQPETTPLISDISTASGIMSNLESVPSVVSSIIANIPSQAQTASAPTNVVQSIDTPLVTAQAEHSSTSLTDTLAKKITDNSITDDIDSKVEENIETPKVAESIETESDKLKDLSNENATEESNSDANNDKLTEISPNDSVQINEMSETSSITESKSSQLNLNHTNSTSDATLIDSASAVIHVENSGALVANAVLTGGDGNFILIENDGQLSSLPSGINLSDVINANSGAGFFIETPEGLVPCTATSTNDDGTIQLIPASSDDALLNTSQSTGGLMGGQIIHAMTDVQTLMSYTLTSSTNLATNVSALPTKDLKPTPQPRGRGRQPKAKTPHSGQTMLVSSPSVGASIASLTPIVPPLHKSPVATQRLVKQSFPVTSAAKLTSQLSQSPSASNIVKVPTTLSSVLTSASPGPSQLAASRRTYSKQSNIVWLTPDQPQTSPVKTVNAIPSQTTVSHTSAPNTPASNSKVAVSLPKPRTTVESTTKLTITPAIKGPSQPIQTVTTRKTTATKSPITAPLTATKTGTAPLNAPTEKTGTKRELSPQKSKAIETVKSTPEIMTKKKLAVTVPTPSKAVEVPIVPEQSNSKEKLIGSSILSIKSPSKSDKIDKVQDPVASADSSKKKDTEKVVQSNEKAPETRQRSKKSETEKVSETDNKITESKDTPKEVEKVEPKAQKIETDKSQTTESKTPLKRPYRKRGIISTGEEQTNSAPTEEIPVSSDSTAPTKSPSTGRITRSSVSKNTPPQSLSTKQESAVNDKVNSDSAIVKTQTSSADVSIQNKETKEISKVSKETEETKLTKDESKGTKEIKSTKEESKTTKDTKDTKDDTKDTKDTKDKKEELKSNKETKSAKEEAKVTKEGKDIKETKGVKESKEIVTKETTAKESLDTNVTKDNVEETKVEKKSDDSKEHDDDQNKERNSKRKVQFNITESDSEKTELTRKRIRTTPVPTRRSLRSNSIEKDKSDSKILDSDKTSEIKEVKEKTENTEKTETPEKTEETTVVTPQRASTRKRKEILRFETEKPKEEIQTEPSKQKKSKDKVTTNVENVHEQNNDIGVLETPPIRRRGRKPILKVEDSPVSSVKTQNNTVARRHTIGTTEPLRHPTIRQSIVKSFNENENTEEIEENMRRKTLSSLSDLRSPNERYDYKTEECNFYVRQQPTPLSIASKEGSGNYLCPKCGFHTTRMNNLVWHHKDQCTFVRNAVIQQWQSELQKRSKAVEVSRNESKNKHKTGESFATTSKSGDYDFEMDSDDDDDDCDGDDVEMEKAPNGKELIEETKIPTLGDIDAMLMGSDDEELLAIDIDKPKKEFGFGIDDIVWIESRNIHWPSLVTKIYSKEKKASLRLIDGPWTKKSMKVDISMVSLFDNSEINKKYLDDGRKSVHGDLLVKAVQKAEDFLRKRCLGNDISAAQFFETSLDGDDNEQLTEDEETLHQNNDKKSLTNNDNSTSDDAIGQSHSPSMNNESDDDAHVYSDSLEAMAQWKERRKLQNAKLLQCIKEGKVETHLVGVYRETIDSERHQKFRSGSDAEKNQLKHVPWFGPIDDEEQQEEIYDYCSQLFKTNFKTDGSFDTVAYIFEVWVPEAIVKAISRVRRLELKDAEHIFAKGVILSKSEKDELTKEIQKEAEKQAERASHSLDANG